jgi:DNA mismatch repair protein MSH4
MQVAAQPSLAAALECCSGACLATETILPDTENPDPATEHKITLVAHKHFHAAQGEALFGRFAMFADELRSELTPAHFAAFAALVSFAGALQGLAFADRSLRVVVRGAAEGTMSMGSATLTSLNVLTAGDDGQSPSLVSVLDRTQTRSGFALLARTCAAPPSHAATIRTRQDALEELLAHPHQLPFILQALKGLPVDVLRLCGELAGIDRTARLTGTPMKRASSDLRTLVLLVDTLRHLVALGSTLTAYEHPLLVAVRTAATDAGLAHLLETLSAVLAADIHFDKAPLALRAQLAFAVRSTTSSLLQVARTTYTESLEDMTALVDELRLRTGLASLRIRYSTKKGYFLSVPTAAVGATLPADFVQVTRSRSRVEATTAAFASLNTRNAESFGEIVLHTATEVATLLGDARSYLAQLHEAGDGVARLDMLSSFASLVLGAPLEAQPMTRPEFLDAATAPIAIKQGKHPTMVLRARGPLPSVPNDTFLSREASFYLLTGPNNAGKSTFVRQTALLTIMAHVGCYLPASYASFRPVDRLIARLDEVDAINEDCSTFQRACRDAAFTLQAATSQSLVLIDEFGRATDPDDGAALAFALAERLATGPARPATLFVTHFASLHRVADLYPGARRIVMEAAERSEPGASGVPNLAYTYRASFTAPLPTSYGISVAEAMGIPAPIVTSARARATEATEATAAERARPDTVARLAAHRRARRRADLAGRIRILQHSSLSSAGLASYLAGLRSEFRDVLTDAEAGGGSADERVERTTLGPEEVQVKGPVGVVADSDGQTGCHEE